MDRVCRILPCLVPVAVLACSSPPEPRDTRPAAEVQEQQRRALVEAGRFSGEAWHLDLNEVAQARTHDRCLQVEGGLLFVQDQNDTVHAIDLQHGLHDWVVDLPDRVTQPVTSGRRGVSLIVEDALVAVDRQIGARIIGRPALDLAFWPWSGAADFGDTLYVGCAAPYGVQAVDAVSGFSGWLYPTRAPVRQIAITSTEGAAQVLAATDDGLLVSLPPLGAAGRVPQENWYRRLPGAGIRSSFAVAGESLYVAADDTFLYCIDANSGAVRWKAGCSGPMVCGVPLVAEGLVLVGARNGVDAFDAATGAAKWSCPGALRPVTRVGALVYLEMPGKEISVRLAEDGTEVSSYSVAGLANIPLVQGGGLFVAGDGAGHLLALR